MNYSFQDGKAIYTPFNGRLYLDNAEGTTWPKSFSLPVDIDKQRTQIYVNNDDVQIRLSFRNIPANATLMTVREIFRPAIPCEFTVVRDSAPYKHVGIAVLSPSGEFQVIQEAAGNVQIYGNYKVKKHD